MGRKAKSRLGRPRSDDVMARPMPGADVFAELRNQRQRETPSDFDPHSWDPIGEVPRLMPQYAAPTWMGELADVLRRSFLAASGIGPPVMACASYPPQTGKTSLVLCALASWLRYRPQDTLIYISYSDQQAELKSMEVRDLAAIAGVTTRDDASSRANWFTPEGGGMHARGIIGGAITGLSGATFIVIDDSLKGRRDAESAAIRQAIHYSWRANISTRLHARTSVLQLGTRWHSEDLIGYVTEEEPDA